jgi:hypothetical protein
MSWTHPGQVYDFAAVSHAQFWLLPGFKWLRPYAYPPTALLLLAPFGRLPFWVALGLWVALGFGVLFYAGLRLSRRRRSLALLLIACSPAVVLAGIVGQSVLLTTALMVLAVIDFERRPRFAGALIALAAAIKPQVALLAPVALIAGGAFETLASAAIAEALLVAASVMIFGPGRWSEWFASLPAFQAVIDSTPGLAPGAISPGGAAHALGLTGVVATAWRAAFALVGAAVVWLGFAVKRSGPDYRLAALSAGTLLAAPYAMHYDGAFLVPAAAVMAVESLQARSWILRLLAFFAVCQVTGPYQVLLSVLAFVGLTVCASFMGEASVRAPDAAPDRPVASRA